MTTIGWPDSKREHPDTSLTLKVERSRALQGIDVMGGYG